jgi:hypothetical protein
MGILTSEEPSGALHVCNGTVLPLTVQFPFYVFIFIDAAFSGVYNVL